MYQTAYLPFTVTIAESEEDKIEAIQIRREAYSRHAPQMAARMTDIEAADRKAEAVILLARSKLDGSPVGTMRIASNRVMPLEMERSIAIPEAYRGQVLAEAARLGIARGPAGAMVRVALFKALWMHCVAEEIDWMIVAARHPLDRIYVDLMFEDMFNPNEFIPLKHASDIPHRVMMLEMRRVREIWENAKHPLYEFMCQTHHPDISVGREGQAPLLLHSAEPSRLQRGYLA